MVDGVASGPERFAAALSGILLDPPARGATFIAPGLLPDAVALGPSGALVGICADARLDFCFVPSWEPWAAELVEALHQASVAALWVAPGVLTPVLESLGHAEGLRATVRDPGSLAPSLDRAEVLMLAAVGAGVEARVDAIVVADDLAGETGLLVTPGFATAEVLPRLARAAAIASEVGKPALLHTDGDASLLLRGARSAGFAGVHLGGVSAKVFEALFAAARSEGLAVVGGLAARRLDGGPFRGVSEGTRLAILAAAGGLLIADDGGVSTADQFEALLAAFGAAGATDQGA